MLIKISDFYSFLDNISKGNNNIEVLIPVPVNGTERRFFFTRLNESNNYDLGFFRSVDPIKVLFYQPRESVLPISAKTVKRIIAGIKSCDMKAIQLLDKALVNNDFVDISYKNLRDSTYIITTDCTETHSSCHCTLLDGKPFTESGFDLNLSPVDDYYLITIGTDKGKELIELINQNYRLLDDNETVHMEISQLRNKIIEKLTNQNEKFLPRNHDDLREKDLAHWNEESKECIGCGACTNICPTCYCLILNDESTGKEFIKVRSYDSCQLHGYARVAGGASPRPKMYERFRNRYLCKFDYMKKNFGESGCVGCGRCTEACAAKIDFREVTQNISMITTTAKHSI